MGYRHRYIGHPVRPWVHRPSSTDVQTRWSASDRTRRGVYIEASRPLGPCQRLFRTLDMAIWPCMTLDMVHMALYMAWYRVYGPIYGLVPGIWPCIRPCMAMYPPVRPCMAMYPPVRPCGPMCGPHQRTAPSMCYLASRSTRLLGVARVRLNHLQAYKTRPGSPNPVTVNTLSTVRSSRFLVPLLMCKESKLLPYSCMSEELGGARAS